MSLDADHEFSPLDLDWRVSLVNGRKMISTDKVRLNASSAEFKSVTKGDTSLSTLVSHSYVIRMYDPILHLRTFSGTSRYPIMLTTMYTWCILGYISRDKYVYRIV